MSNPITDKARRLAERAIDVAEEVMGDSLLEPRDRLRAAEMALDRAYGKAAQAVIHLPNDRAQRQIAAQYSDEQLANIIEGEIVSRGEREQAALPAPEKDPLLE